MRSINSKTKQAELSVHLELHQPDILGITESWLDASTPYLAIPNYSLISRRDRPGHVAGTMNHGGILLYSRNGGIMVTHLEDSNVAERSWHAIHTNVGPILFGLWYRPPGAPREHTSSLQLELDKLSGQAIGVYVIGDMNIHHKKWLRHSAGNTAEGQELQDICTQYNLVEKVQAPTRGQHLLDLVLTSMPDHTTAKLLPQIADHNGVLIQTRVDAEKTCTFQRQVFDFGKARWKEMRRELREANWGAITVGSADEATHNFTEHILFVARRHINFRTITEKKTTHLLINDRL